MNKKDRSAELFEKYIQGRNVLIVDPDSVTRSNIAAILVKLGAASSRVKLSNSYEDAEKKILKYKPEIVFCEFMIKGRSGLDLLKEQREQLPEMKDSLFILVTSNTSQSAVAEAAEEDVDAYVLKPFTIEMFRNIIQQTAVQKANPSDYLKTIEKGKDLLSKDQKDAALKVFDEAVKMDGKPTLAHFYSGHTHVAKEEIDPAQGRFNDGLKLNKIHYKCLVGLYETYMTQKKYDEAYDVVKRISRYFPANPKRLAAVLRLAITTNNYDDIERYYQNFINLDVRTQMLVRYICAALVVCGKYYLKKKYTNRAMELFNKAQVTAAGDPKILREVVTSLAEENFLREAEDSLQRFPPDTQAGTDFQAMEALVASKTQSSKLVIDHCKKLISIKVYDPIIFRILIEKAVESNLVPMAQDYTQQAVEMWPSRKKEFEEVLNNTEVKAAA